MRGMFLPKRVELNVSSRREKLEADIL
jgi:hypothetical protein